MYSPRVTTRHMLTAASSSFALGLLLSGTLLASSTSTGATNGTAPATNIDAPTFTNDVAGILHENCVSCHRPDHIAPMSLRTYEEARPWAKSIRNAVVNGDMPPWDADPGYGPFSNDISLTSDEIDTLVRWIDAGAPRGDGEAPEPPEFDTEGEWKLGEPDWVIDFEPTAVTADGPDQFRILPIATDFGEDRWIKSVEVLPGDPEVVHHFILWRADESNQMQEAWMSGWAAGAEADEFPAGTARLLPAGRSLVGDFHYHPSGRATEDRTRVGIRFASADEIEKEFTNLWILNATFKIPAGDPNYEAKASYVFPQDARILSLAPHMHYRGKDMSYTAHFPDGSQRELLRVSNYDFNWQGGYEFVEPVEVPAGTRVEVLAHWDNSADNPHNPDPSVDVSWGTDSTDEMLIGFVDYVVDEGVSPKPVSLVIGKLAELAEAHPGQVWRLDSPRTPGGEPETMAIHLPKDGANGGWYVQFGALVLPAPIHEVVWDGDQVTAKAMIPGQDPMPIAGKLVSENGDLELTLQGGTIVATAAERSSGVLPR